MGRLILRNPGGNGGTGKSNGGGRRNITIVLPTYPSEPDDEDTEAPTTSPPPPLDIRFGDSGGSSGQTNSSSAPRTDANSTVSFCASYGQILRENSEGV